MKAALVCGAGGFIGSHLVKRLKAEGSGFAAWTRRLADTLRLCCIAFALIQLQMIGTADVQPDTEGSAPSPVAPPSLMGSNEAGTLPIVG